MLSTTERNKQYYTQHRTRLLALAKHRMERAKKNLPPDHTNPNYVKVKKQALSPAERIRRRKRKNKAWAVRYLGGKCVSCGYDKSLAALDFDHLKPAEKIAGIATILVWGKKRLKTELDKCQLLCANCHREKSFPERAEKY